VADPPTPRKFFPGRRKCAAISGMSVAERVGVVVIGRNEGDRLRACLEALAPLDTATVYVDSASSDDSVAVARACGADVVELTDDLPLSAARGRNTGFDYLGRARPGLRMVQFVDGDCVLEPGWLEAAAGELERDPRLAFVAGRLSERRRDASLYNRLCDMEWDVPPGDVEACGGVFMSTVEAYRDVGGFDPSIVAGEEAELGARVRARGLLIRRIGTAMATHDADMTRFAHWWRRQLRAGHSYAETARHLRSAWRLRRVISNLVYGLGIPSVAVLLLPATAGASSLLFLVHGALVARVWLAQRRRGYRHADAALYAAFTTLGKVPQALGGLKYAWERVLLGRGPEIIEHRQAAP
jgi:GT2 family glycosyltransferase